MLTVLVCVSRIATSAASTWWPDGRLVFLSLPALGGGPTGSRDGAETRRWSRPRRS